MWNLTADEIEAAYARRLAQLTPQYPSVRLPGQPAWAVVIGGLNGVGKSTVQRSVHAALRPTGIVSYDADDNGKVHPQYEALRRDQPLDWFRITAETLDEDEMRRVCLNHIRERDVLLSHPMAREEWARGWLDEFPEHRRTLVYVVAHPACSTIGLGTRFQNGLDGDGATAWVPLELHDAFGAELPGTAQALESGKLVHDLLVCDRDGYVLYENHLDVDGELERTPQAGQAVADAMAMAPTPDEHELVLRGVHGLLDGRDPSLPEVSPEVRELALAAHDREAGRPAPRPRPRDPAQRLEVRLQAIHHRLGRPADLQNLHHLTSAGLVPPGSTPAPGRSAPAGTAPAPGSTAGRTPGSSPQPSSPRQPAGARQDHPAR